MVIDKILRLAEPALNEVEGLAQDILFRLWLSCRATSGSRGILLYGVSSRQKRSGHRQPL